MAHTSHVSTRKRKHLSVSQVIQMIARWVESMFVTRSIHSIGGKSSLAVHLVSINVKYDLMSFPISVFYHIHPSDTDISRSPPLDRYRTCHRSCLRSESSKFDHRMARKEKEKISAVCSYMYINELFFFHSFTVLLHTNSHMFIWSDRDDSPCRNEMGHQPGYTRETVTHTNAYTHKNTSHVQKKTDKEQEDEEEEEKVIAIMK